MNLRKLILTNNDCYKSGRTITVKGIMVHSTGANNPTLKRYVGPDDGLLGKNQYGNHWNTPKPGGRQVCVHGFIGKLADGSVATYQTLPWNMRGWHGGSGKNGSVNDTHIGFEICEDALTDASYFNAVYKEAAELCAYLCKEYNLDPVKDGVIIGHYEGYNRGIASNHGDPKNWFPKHGKSMDTFRAYVKELMGASAPKPTPAPTPAPSTPTTYKVGDIVQFTGKTHYTSANAASGVPCKPGKAKVTQVYNGKHPYHLIHTDSTSNVYGWVDAADIGATAPAPAPAPAPAAPTPTIGKGSKVKVKSGAKTYTGGGLASFVYKNTYDVIEIKGDRVVIGKGTAVTAAVRLADLTLA
jgi:N-acetylmuramoyl-L-alanine amidase